LHSGQKPRATIVARAVALLVIAVFGFHLSRFYLAVEVCSHHLKDSNSIQHCKDVSGWLTAPRVKMDEVPSITLNLVAETAHAGFAPPAGAAPDVSVPPPFHPPRFFS
jgi:hypothetical protein